MNRHFFKLARLLPVFMLIACNTSRQVTTFVLLPDTQGYAEKHPGILHSQIDYILKNQDNIDFVIQQGDLTDDNNDEQWTVVKSAFKKLDGEVPYALAVGNHDMGSTPGKFADVRNTDLFNRYFPYAEMSELPAFGGVFEPGRMENAWYRFRKGNVDWLVLTLEFGPRESVLAWANEIVDQNQDKTVILNTHSYMYADSTRQDGKDSWRPQAYGIGKDSLENRVNDGEQIWEKLVKKQANIRFVFSGHILKSGVGNLVSVNDAGYPVYQFLANYQGGVTGSVNEGNGYLRIVKCDTGKKLLEVKTYSPYIDQVLDKEGHNFVIKHVVLEK